MKLFVCAFFLTINKLLLGMQPYYIEPHKTIKVLKEEADARLNRGDKQGIFIHEGIRWYSLKYENLNDLRQRFIHAKEEENNEKFVYFQRLQFFLDCVFPAFDQMTPNQLLQYQHDIDNAFFPSKDNPDGFTASRIAKDQSKNRNPDSYTAYTEK